MPHYLVMKRTTHDWVSLPGEILTDLNPRVAGILLDRGFITPVPVDYPGRVSTPPVPERVSAPPVQAEAKPQISNEVPATVVPAVQAFEASEASSDEDDREKAFKELMANTRKELNEIAVGVGIEAPEAFAAKREVANAILAAVSESAAES